MAIIYQQQNNENSNELEKIRYTKIKIDQSNNLDKIILFTMEYNNNHTQETILFIYLNINIFSVGKMLKNIFDKQLNENQLNENQNLIKSDDNNVLELQSYSNTNKNNNDFNIHDFDTHKKILNKIAKKLK